ncbi:hypothetical protein RRG08_059637 [Elysia crispata]|uniref:Uncharacterized protein n=1 Tax=Elysia crispata TaxID=231223 RepID=A0AAE1DJL9_9GAST|nr:hypothetical protein RRG08_059637 [Elysia crispata]
MVRHRKVEEGAQLEQRKKVEKSRKEKETEGKKKGRLKECNVLSMGALCINMTRNHEQLRPAAAECNDVSMGALVCQHDQEPGTAKTSFCRMQCFINGSPSVST